MFAYDEVIADEEEEYVPSENDDFEAPKKKRTGRPRTGQKGLGPRRILPDGSITRSHPEARPYNARRAKVTDPAVLAALNAIYAERGTFDRKEGVGHDFNGIRYAQYYGRLDKEGAIGRLWTIVLSSEGKVYQMKRHEKHIEIKWQNDKTKTNPAFGTINLLGEGENYMCSILPAFKSELNLIFRPERP